jgi:hypothetical protein
MSKVISYSLWRTPESKDWPNYLLGLCLNARIRPLLFPDWQVRVYVDDSAWRSAPQLLHSLCDLVDLRAIPKSVHPLMARYLPLWEAHHAVLVRDLDSILSATDADCVAKWLTGKERILAYREYVMEYATIGGGLGVRNSPLSNTLVDSGDALTLRDWRDHDEMLLDELIQRYDSQTHWTRMDTEGHYFFCNQDGSGPYNCLWICTHKDQGLYRFLDDEQLERILVENPNIPLTYLANRQPLDWIR